jgi:hypothetical protein
MGGDKKKDHLHCSRPLLFLGMIALFIVVVKDFFTFRSRASHVPQNGRFQVYFARSCGRYP